MAEMQIKCPVCSGMLKIQSEWCGQSVQCPLCQKTVTAPEAPAPAGPQVAQTATSPDAVKMRINDDIEATPKKIVEMLASVADGKEEFVILSNGDEFLQTCLDKKKNNFHLEYSSGIDGASIKKVEVDSLDVLRQAFLKFYNRDLSFESDFAWRDAEPAKSAESKSEPLDLGCAVILLIGIAIIYLLAMWLFGSWPRTVYWILFPITAIAAGACCGEKLDAVKFCGVCIALFLLGFGWWTHTTCLKKVREQEALGERQKENCLSASVTHQQNILQKFSGQTAVFLTAEWEANVSDIQKGDTDKECRYVVTKKYLGQEIKTIPTDEVILSCKKHSDHLIRAQVFILHFAKNHNTGSGSKNSSREKRDAERGELGCRTLCLAYGTAVKVAAHSVGNVPPEYTRLTKAWETRKFDHINVSPECRYEINKKYENRELDKIPKGTVVLGCVKHKDHTVTLD